MEPKKKKKSKRPPSGEGRPAELSPLDPMKVALPTSPPKKEPSLSREIWDGLPPKKRVEYSLIAAAVMFVLVTAVLIPVFFNGASKQDHRELTDEERKAMSDQPPPREHADPPDLSPKAPARPTTTSAQPADSNVPAPSVNPSDPAPMKVQGTWLLTAGQFFQNPDKYVDQALSLRGKLGGVGKDWLVLLGDTERPRIFCSAKAGEPPFNRQGFKPGDPAFVRARYKLSIGAGQAQYPMEECELGK